MTQPPSENKQPPAPSDAPKTLKDLLREVNPDTELTEEDKEWLNMTPIGRELI